MISSPNSLKFTVAFLALSCVAIASAEQRTPEEWLKAMTNAQRDLSYSGTLSYFDGSDVKTLKYVHIVREGQVHERVLHQNGPRREVVRDGGHMSMELSQDDELLQMFNSFEAGGFPATFNQDIDKIFESYVVEVTGKGRIAGRSAICVSLIPKHKDRYAILLCIDESTSLMLRSELRDEGNRLVSVLQFTELHTSEVDSALLSFSDGKQQAVVVDLKEEKEESAEAILPDVHWHADWLPTGFEKSATDVRSGVPETEVVRNVMYSDGLVSFSVFVEPAPKTLEETTLETVSGPTVCVSHTVRDSTGKSQLVTVVGELPKKTVWRIARSIKFDP